MSLKNYGPDGANLTIGGIPIEEFGTTDPPISWEDIEDRSTLIRGVGGTSLRLDNQTRPKRLTVNVMPGSAEARQLIALEKSGADITAQFSQTDTKEKIAAFDGILQTRGTVGRGGKTSVSDEQFVFAFADSDES